MCERKREHQGNGRVCVGGGGFHPFQPKYLQGLWIHGVSDLTRPLHGHLHKTVCTILSLEVSRVCTALARDVQLCLQGLLNQLMEEGVEDIDQRETDR